MNAPRFLTPVAKTALALTCCLGALPGCTTGAARTHVVDHVYSTGAPRQLDQETDGQTVPVRANYPESSASDGSVRMSDAAAAQVAGTIPVTSVAVASYTSSDDGPRPIGGVAGDAQNPDGAVDASQFTFASVQDGAPEPMPNEPRFVPAEPRQVAPTAPSNAMETVAPSPLADMYPDEYIFDGGDTRFPVHYQGGDIQGLESEDTVAEFTDHTGSARVRASNRVAVYAPRFGSVRVVTAAEADIKVDQASTSRDAESVDNLSTRLIPQGHVANDGFVGFETRQRPDGVDVSLPSSAASVAMRPEESRKFDKGNEARAATIPDSFGQNLSPGEAEAARNAAVWSRSDYPILAASTKAAEATVARFKVQQTVGVEDQRQTKGDVRIIKLADRDTALAGDTIRFTIQFQNTGDFDVYDVSIIDNLTPRLQYVDGSAETDPGHPGEVSVAPNGEGSVVLTFKLDGPLKGHDSGTITFEATVR